MGSVGTQIAAVIGGVSKADALGVVIACGAIAASFTAVVTAAKLPVINRPGRWVWRRLVSEPAAAFLERVLNRWADQPGGVNERLTKLEEQHYPNGGSTTRDRIDRIAAAVGAEPVPDP